MLRPKFKDNSGSIEQDLKVLPFMGTVAIL